MTPEERDRLSRVEVRIDLLEKDFQKMAESMAENFALANQKLDNITQLISASKGAWKALAVVGSFIAVFGGFVVGLIAVWDKILHIFGVR